MGKSSFNKAKKLKNNKLEEIYFKDDINVNEYRELELLKSKVKDIEKKDKLKKTIKEQKKIIKLNEDKIKNQEKKLKGGSNIINEINNIWLNQNINYYNIINKTINEKILLVICNINLVLIIFMTIYNIYNLIKKGKICIAGLIILIFLCIIYTILKLIENKIKKNENIMNEIEKYIDNTNNYLFNNEIKNKDKLKLLENIEKYNNILKNKKINIDYLLNDLYIYLPIILFIIILFLKVPLVNKLIIIIIITLILLPYISILLSNQKNKNIKIMGYIIEKVIIIYISYLIIKLVYNKKYKLNNSDLMLILVDKIKKIILNNSLNENLLIKKYNLIFNKTL